MEILAFFEKSLGYSFKCSALLHNALNVSCRSGPFSHQRLEFLGDALLEYFVVNVLFRGFNQLGPASMSEVKSYMLKNQSFNRLFSQLLEGKDPIAEKWLSKMTNNQKADTFESVVGALWLDANLNFEVLWKIIQPILIPKELAVFIATVIH